MVIKKTHSDTSLDTAVSLKRVTLTHPPNFNFLKRKTAALIFDYFKAAAGSYGKQVTAD